MQVTIKKYRKFPMFWKFGIDIHVDCEYVNEMDSIELSVLQMLSAIKSYDFGSDNDVVDTNEEKVIEDHVMGFPVADDEEYVEYGEEEDE